MDNKLEKLAALRKQKESIENQINDLIAELTGIIKPVRKRKAKQEGSESLPSIKL
jgi:hypothetical protein